MKPTLPASEPKEKRAVGTFLFLHGTLLIYALVSAFAKLAGNGLAAEDSSKALLFLGLEVLALGIYSILWQLVLKRMPLHFAYANKGVCTLWTALICVVFFGETLSPGKLIGLAVVLAGIALVVTDHE